MTKTKIKICLHVGENVTGTFKDKEKFLILVEVEAAMEQDHDGWTLCVHRPVAVVPIQPNSINIYQTNLDPEDDGFVEDFKKHWKVVESPVDYDRWDVTIKELGLMLTRTAGSKPKAIREAITVLDHELDGLATEQGAEFVQAAIIDMMKAKEVSWN